MQRISTKSRWTSRLKSGVAVFALLGGAGIVASGASALTEAGQRIQNQATATYQDALNNEYTAQSNLASVEVRQVFAATLESDGVRTVAANQTAYFQHILTNTGNGEDTYTVSVVDVDGGNPVTGLTDSGNFADLQVFEDQNNNGVADAGEPVVTQVTLGAGDEVSLVVAGRVPTAAAGSTFASTITVVPTAGSVDDLTPSNGLDAVDGTNQDIATISEDAVLNIFKSSVHDVANSEITYTITVTNTGSQEAQDVIIFDGLPDGTSFVSATTSGFGTAINAADTDVAAFAQLAESAPFDFDVDGNTTDATESDFGLDLDSDGTIEAAGVPGLFAVDDTLAAGQSIELNFTIAYDPDTFEAGEEIENVAFVSADTDGDGTPDGTPIPSARVTDLVPQLFSVAADDTGANDANGVNDGGDDDALTNDAQFVDAVQSGEEVLFEHVITNNGNGVDTFELTLNNTSATPFPPGTSFTFWNETGTVALLNTNGEGSVDTGPLDPGEALTITIKAQLPPDAPEVLGDALNPASLYTLTATSSANPASTPVLDTTTGVLGSILAPTVDLTNTAPDTAVGTDGDAFVPGGAPITTETANPGDTVSFTLFVTNDSAVADSFQLDAGGSFIGGALGGLPAGFQVDFRDTSGAVITTTPSIGSGQSLQITADVTIPASELQALADREADIDGSGVRRLDGNSDTDGDYGIFFQVSSVNSGASDIKLDAVDVLANEEITLLQDNSGQVQPGGSIDYPHTLQNDGNTTETLSLGAANGTSGFSNNLLVDTDGDGEPDTAFEALPPTGQITIVDQSGALVQRTLVGGEVVLEPGESLPFVVRVFAPTQAPNGQLDILTVTAQFNGGASEVENIDRSEVVTAQLRLAKSASVDASCDDAGALDLGPDVAFSETANDAAPGDCIVWQVVATNAGVDVVNDVDITDAVPAFTVYRPGTLRICNADAGQAISASCTFTDLTDVADADEGSFAANDVRFALGNTTTANVVPNGEILPGASVTIRFSTEVE